MSDAETYSAERNSSRGGRFGKAAPSLTRLPENVASRLIKQSRCQRASRPDLTVARARCMVDDDFTSSERHGHRPIEKSSVPVGSLRSKFSPRIYSSSRRLLDIASSSGGIFGAGDARCDRDAFRRVELFLECECFLGGEPVWERGLFWDGEPPYEPFSTNSFSQTPARSAPRPAGIDISTSVI